MYQGARTPGTGGSWRKAAVRLPAANQFGCGGVSQCKPLRWFWPGIRTTPASGVFPPARRRSLERSRRWPMLPPDSDPARRNGNRPPEGPNFRGRTPLMSGRSCRSACGRTTSVWALLARRTSKPLTLNLRKENHGTTSLTRTPWQFVAEMAYVQVSSVIRHQYQARFLERSEPVSEALSQCSMPG